MFINGEPLKALRTSSGLTQKELANLSGVSERTIQHIEDGDSNPSFATLVLLADYLNVPLDILCDRNIDRYCADSRNGNLTIIYRDDKHKNKIARLISYLQLGKCK